MSSSSVGRKTFESEKVSGGGPRRRSRGTYVGDSALVDGIRVAVDGEEVGEALAKDLVVDRLAGEVEKGKTTEDLRV